MRRPKKSKNNSKSIFFLTLFCSVLITKSSIAQQDHRHHHRKVWRQDADDFETRTGAMSNDWPKTWTNNDDNRTNQHEYRPNKLLRSIEDDDDLHLKHQTTQIDENLMTIFQQQQRLPFDKSLNVLLKQTKRFYFQISKRKENISLTVTPCGGGPNTMDPSTPFWPIKLEFYFINSKTIRKFRKRKIGRRSQNNLVKMINRKLLNHHTNRKLLLIERLVDKPRLSIGNGMIFQPGLYIVQLSINNQQPPSELQQFEDPGYRIELYLSFMSDDISQWYPKIPPVATIMTKQIYAQWRLDHLLDGTTDSDPNANNESTVVEIWWNPVVDDDGQYEYCLLIQENHPFNDDCLSGFDDSVQNQDPLDSDRFNQILDQDHDDHKSTLWSYSSELDRKRLELELDRDWESQFAYFKCFRSSSINQTSVQVHGLRPAQLYFVDVFVRNMDQSNNRLISKYWTTNFTLTEPDMERKIWKEHFDSMPTLHDSLFTGVFLDSKNQFRKRFLYKIVIDPDHQQDGSINDKVYIYIQPCSGVGPIQFMVKQISMDHPLQQQMNDRKRRHNHRHRRGDNGLEMDDNLNLFAEMAEDSLSTSGSGTVDPDASANGMLFFEEITETRTIELQIGGSTWTNHSLLVQGEPKTIYLEFELNTMTMLQSRSVVLLASNYLNKFPFPRLPNDKTIRAMETLRQCDSITLVWNASPDERVTYCILQRDAKYGTGFEESRHLCQRIRPPAANAQKRHASDTEPSASDTVVVYDSYAMEYSQPTRKVLCRRYRAKKRVNNLIMQQVRKLYPGKQYVFMVTIKGRQHTLNYEQVWAETKDQDQCVNVSNGNGRRRSWRSRN